MSLSVNGVPIVSLGGTTPALSTALSPITATPGAGVNIAGWLATSGTIAASGAVLTTPLPVGSGGTGSSAAANTANGIVTLNQSAQLPAVDGSLLTNISAGALSKITTSSPSAVSSFTISSLTTAFYMLTFTGTQNTSNGAAYIKFNGDSGANYTTGGGSPNNVGVSYAGGTGQTSISLNGNAATAGTSFSINIWFQTDANTANNVQVVAVGWHTDTTHGYSFDCIGGIYTGSGTLSSVTIGTSAGTLTGKAILYKYT